MTRVEKFAKYREEIKNMKEEDFPKDAHPDYKPKHSKPKMWITKKVKHKEVAIGYDATSVDGHHIQAGRIIVQCPYCGKPSEINFIDRDGDRDMYEKYCPYCGRKLVWEAKK